MVHGHAHVHEHRPHEIERRGFLDDDDSNPLVGAYRTMSKGWEDAFGGGDDAASTKEDTNTATAQNTLMGVGPAVAATRPSPQTTEKTIEAPTTTAKDPPKHEATTTESEKDTPTETHATQTKEASPETTKEAKETKAEPTTTSEDNKAATKIEPTSTPTASFVTSVASTTADPSQDVNALAATNTASTTNSAASASPTSLNTKSEGMSSGAKAGAAIGVILGVGVIAALIFFIIRKKKRSQAMREEVEENEKAAFSLPPPPPVAKPSTPSSAPQLNVRPVTQFAPDLTGNGGFNPATAAGAAAAAGVGAGTAAAASRNLTGNSPPPTPPKSAAGSNPFNDPVNPFSNNTTPVAEHAPGGMPGSAAGAAAMGAVGGAAMASHERAHSPPGSSPSPVSVDGESVASATFAADGAAGMSAVAGAAAGTSPNNVHRVQMDFNPSMEDELGLRTGSLVRMLHEYDDGWALCVRLDRSQQGVAPRSCLSARPVKPRSRPPPGARGPPMGPNGRILSGPPPGRFYPGDVRPRSPAGLGYAGPPRPYPESRSGSPVQFPMPGPMGPSIRPVPRSMSPGPYGPSGMQRQPVMPVNQRQRSNSAGNMPSPNVGAMPPKSPSPLAATEPPAPAPTAELPAIPSSSPSSPGSQVNRKPLLSQNF